MHAVSGSPRWAPASRSTALSLCIAASCAGCATGIDALPRDPLEPLNRSIFGFNEAIDKAVFRPAALVYRDATPSVVRAGISNFLGNLEDVWSFVNNLLQFKGQAAARTFMRVNVNTVMGLGGILDVASDLGMERRDEDFGQTLGYWGVTSGPYLVLPFFGPTTMRDFIALPVDSQGYVVSRIHDIAVRNTLEVLDQLDTRVDLLEVENTLSSAALDRYSFIRDAYLQRRRNAVFDGDPPDEEAPAKPAKR